MNQVAQENATATATATADAAATASLRIKKGSVLVALKSEVQGGVQYVRTDKEAPQPPGSAVRRAWETVQTVLDPDERRKAMALRNLWVSRIWSKCVKTSFGLVCVPEAQADLDKTVAAAVEAARAFNQEAQHTNVSIRVLRPVLLLEDAGEALAEEVAEADERLRDLLEKEAPPDAIRKAATDLQAVTPLLQSDLQAALREKIKQARARATSAAAVARGEKPLSPEEQEARAAARAKKAGKSPEERAAAERERERKTAERSKKLEEKAAAAAERERKVQARKDALETRAREAAEKASAASAKAKEAAEKAAAAEAKAKAKAKGGA